MKRIIVLMSVIALFTMFSFAQEKTHVVKKGETVATIAKTYGVTIESLQDANPDLKSYIYVGMSLKIPTINEQETKQTNIASEAIEKNTIIVENKDEKENKVLSTMIGEGDNTIQNIEYDKHSVGKGYVGLDIMYGFLGNPDNMYSSPFSYSATIRYSYFFHHNVYISGGLGYNSSSFLMKKKYGDYDYDFHFISVPVRLGVSLAPDSKFDLVPYAGINFNYCVKASIKNGNNKIDNDWSGKMAIEGMIGARVNISGFSLVVGYNIPFNDNQKASFGEDGYLNIGLGCGF